LTLIDTHCHLDAPEFDADRAAVIARTWEAGVGAVMTIGTDLAGSRQAVALAESDPRIWATVGIDPHDAEAGTPEVLAEIRKLARHPRVVAIGEIGLDYYPGPPDDPWHKAPREVQQQVFEAQLAIAAEAGKPVVIHCRDAHDDVLAMLHGWKVGKVNIEGWKLQNLQPFGLSLRAKPSTLRAERLGRRLGGGPQGEAWNLQPGGVMHCFSGTADQALQFVELGLMISLAGPLTFVNARKPVEVARRVPLDWLVVETDSPYLSPHPFRGKRNEPARLRLVAEKLAEIKALPFEAIAAATTANAQRLFGIPIQRDP
jgi:TatD DNase family protein